LRSKGFSVNLSVDGKLFVGPKKKLTLPLQEWIRKAHPLIVEELQAEPLESVAEVVELARHMLNPTGIEYDPHPVPPAPPGRDPLVQRGGDKVTFFRGDWQEAEPQDFTVHRPDGVA
jgi:hypothetical protein